MANRFEQPIESQFINTYVPIPFEEMMKAGQMKQSKYDQTAAAIDSNIQRAESIDAIPNSPDDAYKKQVVQKMYDIRDQYVGKDLSDPFVYRQMNNDINKGIDKDWVQKMQQSKMAWDETQKAKRTLDMQGKWNSSLDSDPGNKWNSKDAGVYNHTPHAFEDKASLFRPYYQDLKPESQGIIDVNGYAVQRDAITSGKVSAVAKQGAQELASTPQGQDHINLYKQAHKDTKLTDVEILQQEMNDYGKNWVMSNDQVLGASLQKGRKGGNSDNGAIDSEWFVAKGAVPVSGQNTDRKALAAVDKENEVNKASLNGVDATLKELENKKVPTTDIRYKTALQQKEKLTNDISKYEESMAQVNQNTEIAMQKKIEELKTNMVPTLAKALGMDENDPTIRTLLDEHLNKQFGKGFRELGDLTGSTVTKGLANSASMIPGIAGMIINKAHRFKNMLGIMSDKDNQRLLDSVDKAITDTGITENSGFAERTSAGWKALHNYVKDSRVGWGSSVKKSITDNSFLVKMRDFDKQINTLENNRDQVRNEEKAAIFNYNVSDMMVKPLNYTTKQGRVSIIAEDGTEYDSQINDFYTALKINPSSFDIADVSEGNKLTTGTKKFNQEVQGIMASYEPLPGMIIPKIDKDGNMKVLVSYQVDGKNNTKAGIKKFEVKVKDDHIINAFANDYKASGYTNSYLRLVNRKLHQDVETYANSKQEHDYPIMVPNKKGGVDEASITGKRIGSEYVAIDPDTNNVLTERSSDGTTREVRFNTKEEFENWLYAKQHFLLTGKN
jgi:hypothetical protein